MRADELLAMQRQFLAALREPLVGASRARTDLPPDPGTPSPAFAATAEAWLTPSAALAPTERLELYHRQYWYRLLDSLAEDFPAVQRLLGPQSFSALIERYVAATPPHTFSLRDLGAGLAAFVAADPVEAHAAHVIDLARLEYAWILAFDAPARPPAPAAGLATTPLALQPHLTVLALHTAADTFWRRTTADQPRGRLGAARESPHRFVAVHRDGLQRQVERLHPAAFTILHAVARDGNLGGALDAAAPQLPRRGAALIQAWFQAWTERGWLVPRAAS